MNDWPGAIEQPVICENLGVSEKTAQNKLQGITAFTYPEFKRTCILLLPEYNADYLFTTEEEAVSEAGRKVAGV